MAGFPTFKLYETDGITLVYEFDCVIDLQPIIADDSTDFVVHKGLRGHGGINVNGSKNTYDTTITFYLKAIGDTDQEKYISLRDQIDEIIDAIPTGTRFLLKVDKDLSNTETRRVVRYSRIDSPLGQGQKMLNSATINITFQTQVF